MSLFWARRPDSERCIYRGSIGDKLLVLALCVLAPFCISEAVEIYSDTARVARYQLQASRDLAESTGTSFRNFLESLWKAEHALGAAIFLSGTPLSPDEARTLMANQLNDHPIVLVLSWLNPSGVVVASTNRRAEGVSLADRAHIRAIMAGADTAVSKLVNGRLASGPVIGVTRGIRSRKGQLQGIILATVKPAWLGQVTPHPRTAGEVTGLVDRSGTIVYATSRPEAAGMKIQVDRRHRDRFSLNRARHLGSVVAIRGVGWTAFAGRPELAVFSSVIHNVALDATTLLAAAIVSGIGVALLSRDLLQRATALGEAATALSEGDLSVRVRLPGEDELAAAATAFNQMATRVQGLETERVQFIQVAAHELRTPLTAIKGVCSLLQHELANGGTGEQTAKLSGVLEREVDHLSTLVTQILDTFLAHEGRLPVRKGTVDLVAVVRSALQPFEAAGGSRFRFTCVESRVWVTGDEARLGQVVRNLLSNAAKYSPSSSHVSLALTLDSECAQLSVTDHGRGIPADQLGRVFEPFYRATNVEDGYGSDGIGLGLPICRDIILRHGGSIWVDSRQGRGSTFYVRLPLAKDQSR